MSQLLLRHLIVASLAVCAYAHAADYYVDQASAAANDQNPGTQSAPWKTIAKANQALSPGDTVYIKAGNYNTYVSPARSGTSNARITYRNFESDVVTIENAAFGILLDAKSFITVQGLNFTNLDRFMYLRNGANYNIVAFSKFQNGRSNSWTGSIIHRNSSYNWIHHSTFSHYGGCSSGYGSGSDQGTTLDIGDEEDGTDASNFNVVEDSVLYHGGHHVLGVFSRFNTIRNNYLHNEAWSNGRGHRNLYLQGIAGASGSVLIEGNRFGYAARPCNDASPTVASVKLTTSNNIFRFNSIYHSVATGLTVDSYVGSGSQYDVGSNNRIYNNTIYNSGYNIDPSYKGGTEDTAVWFAHSVNVGNVLKNNLYAANRVAHTGFTSQQSFANNWQGEAQGDPRFQNAPTTPSSDKSNLTTPDLHLRPDSPVIDKGGALTTVTSASGSGLTLTVGDSKYLQDGRYGPPGVVQADWIAIGNISNVAQIAAISGNVITLVSPVSWTSGGAVWLYKKSDGARVLHGAAPEPGAYEYSPSIVLQPPTNLRVQ
jgi:Protein of unknown function (DUF1565)